MPLPGGQTAGEEKGVENKQGQLCSLKLTVQTVLGGEKPGLFLMVKTSPPVVSSLQGGLQLVSVPAIHTLASSPLMVYQGWFMCARNTAKATVSDFRG